MLFEWTPKADTLKAKGLKGSKYYYVFFFATHPSARGQGLCSQIIRHYQTLAAKENMPIWLEATTARSRAVYAKEGFELVGEVVLGKGKVGEDGLKKKGGPGVTAWGMVWWPSRASVSQNLG